MVKRANNATVATPRTTAALLRGLASDVAGIASAVPDGPVLAKLFEAASALEDAAVLLDQKGALEWAQLDSVFSRLSSALR